MLIDGNNIEVIHRYSQYSTSYSQGYSQKSQAKRSVFIDVFSSYSLIHSPYY
ncbi:MAG: hypothetical protein LBB05_03055 [Puniceicoccales bacterium]|nr:hypothetical protein [Puniceicoccales bacterium]